MKNYDLIRELYNDLIREGNNRILFVEAPERVAKELRRYAPYLKEDLDNLAAWGLKESTSPSADDALIYLFALSRVADLLVTAIQGGMPTDPFIEFLEFLGFSQIDRGEFHPFFHEIVKVHQSEGSSAPIAIDDMLWPGFMFGGLMFLRSGVTIRSGSDHVNKAIAEKSTLYWHHRRKHRRTEDLSLGWGHNSQWSTEYRRDYELSDRYVFNIDQIDRTPAGFDVGDDLTKEEVVELVRNRCFVQTDKPHQGRFPYDEFFIEPK